MVEWISRGVSAGLLAVLLVGCGDKKDGPREPKATSLSAGAIHACEVRTNGSLWCWGYGNQGQLGSFDLSDPVIETGTPQRVGDRYDWAWVEAGLAHNCAARTDGSLHCWGFNVSGELGVGSSDPFLVDPTEVSSGTTWSTVSSCSSCFRAFNLGIQNDGSLWSWGLDIGGRLGLGPVTETSVPLQIGSDTDWSQVTAGAFVSFGIKNDGSLWGWGENSTGMLGDGTNVSRLVPGAIGTETDWARVASGLYRTCALKNDGGLWCWGIDGNVPVAINAGTTYQTVDVGDAHTCAIQTDGTLWCAGTNNRGQLGIESRDSTLDLTRVGEDADWVDIIASDDFTCGLREGGSRWCWGYNWRSQLGTGATATKRSPSAVTSAASFARVSSGPSESTLALGSDGSLWQWGRVTVGPSEKTPTQVGTDTNWAVASAGGFHNCGVRGNSLWCWGSGNNGALGNGAEDTLLDPTQIGSATWKSVSAGQNYSCGIQGDDSLWCWGDNLDGQLGDGSGTDSLVPINIAPGTQWSTLAAGEEHTCGVQLNGSAWCWGRGFDGQLGDDNSNSSLVPVAVLGGNWRQLSVGNDFTCGTRDDNTLWCWGDNSRDQLGAGDGQPVAAPAQVPDTDWSTVDAGDDHACAIKNNGTLWCWGDHIEGQAGVGGALFPLFIPPTQVGTGTDWVSVDAGNLYTCATRANGTAHCFGLNREGQLGDGTAWFTSPQPVQ